MKEVEEKVRPMRIPSLQGCVANRILESDRPPSARALHDAFPGFVHGCEESNPDENNTRNTKQPNFP